MSFELVTLEELAAPIKNAIVGGPFGSNLVSKDYVAAGVPVIRGQNMGDKWVNGEFVFVTNDKARTLEQNKARPGDLVFTQRGTLGQVSIVPNGAYPEYVVSQSQMKITLDPTKAHTDFIYYQFKTKEQLDYIRNSSIQTGVPHTNLGILRKTPVLLPPLEIQKSISNTLSMLDSRIDLLRETNATLESIAQALFKSWFVDFDPVHANAGTQAPSLPPEIQGLFPATFTDASQGPIPEGWEQGCLTDVLSLRNEKVKASNETSQLPYVPIEAITAKSPFLSESKSGMDANSSLTLFRKGDILFGAMRPYFHKVCIAPFDGVTRTTVFTLCPKNKFSTAFGLFVAYQESTIAFATQHSEGSTIPYAKWKNSLELMATIVPPVEVQQAFNEIVMPLIEAANANIEKSQTLTNLRDTLLPRLISGQLRLHEAEQAIAAITD